MATKAKKTVKLSLEFDRQRLRDLLDNAIESGIGYWCSDTEGGTGYDDPFWTRGVALLFRERETGERLSMTLGDLVEALAESFRKHPRVFAAWAGFTDDAMTADVIVQLAVFGKVKYG